MDGSTSAKVVDQQHTPGSSGSRSGSGIELSSQVVHERSSLHEEQDEDTTMSRGSEHEPLIGGSNNGSRQRTAQDRTGSGSNNAGQTPQVADRRQVYLAYACFVVLGATVLLPWNMLIVVTPYFDLRLRESPHFANTASNWVPLIYTIGNFALLVYATYSLQKRQSGGTNSPSPRKTHLKAIRSTSSSSRSKSRSNGSNSYSNSNAKLASSSFESLERRTVGSVVALSVVVAALWWTTKVDEFDTGLFFVIMMLISIVSSSLCGILQSSSAALASLFEDPFYLQGVMSGQGMIGFTVAVTQFFAAWQAAKPSSSSPASASATLEGTALQVQDEAIITATSRFFFVSLIFSIFAALASLTLTRWIPLYRDIKDRGTLARIPARNRDDHHEHMDGDLDEDDDAQESHPAVDQQAPSSIHELFRVNRKILGLGLAVFNIFLVTIGLFPGITSSVAAVNLEWPIGSPLLWVPFGFVLFNAADWLGRALPGFRPFVISDKKYLILASIARMLFIPLILLCNVQIKGTHGTRTPLFNSDVVYLILLILFSLSNGYLTSLLMMRAMMEPTLERHEVDVASSIMLIYLTAGLTGGAMLSFAVKAVVS